MSGTGTIQMVGSQSSSPPPRTRDQMELQQIERIRLRLEEELRQATKIEKEIRDRSVRLEGREVDKAALKGLDDSTLINNEKILKASILSMHAYMDSKLNTIQNTLEQILNAMHKPGIRPAVLSSLPFSAMTGPYVAQSGPPPSGTSAAALSQTVASSSSGPATGATPQSPLVSPAGQQFHWYPKTPLKPPPAFSGDKKDEALNTWLRTVPVWVRAKRTLVEEEVITSASYLEGSATHWLNGLVASKGFGKNIVLAQQEGKKLRPVEYMSKKMPSKKLPNSTYERELYALYKTLVHWRHYLLGRFFYLRTDNQTLKWIKTQPVLSDAFKRWIEVIDQYDFKLDYLKGEYTKVTDALSRRADYLGALIYEFGLSEDVTRSMEEAYREDPITMDIINKLRVKDKATTDEFVMVDGLLFLEKAGFKRLVVPSKEDLRNLFLGECHAATGHFDYKKTSANLEQRFWWPNMLDDAKKYVQTCQVCQRDKPWTRAPLGLLKPLPIPAGPGQSISMDFMDTLVTSKNGKRHNFVIVDRFTKYARLIVMPKTVRTEHVIKLFMDNWGNLFKAQRHFTQLKRYAAATIDVFVDIWNHREYEFDQRNHRGIMAYMREHDIADRRAVEEFLVEEAGRAEAGGSEEGGGAGPSPDLSGEDLVMTARGKRPVESGVEGVPQGRKRQRQSRLDEVYDPDGQAGFRDTFLQWAYNAGILFAAFRRQSWIRHKKQLAAMPRGVRPVYPSFKDIGGAGIDEQRGKVAAMLREVRSSFESVGATILSDGRQSRDARLIVNFLEAAKRGALLYATVQRDGSASETTQIARRNALESMLHDDEWDKIPWEPSKRRQTLWVRQIRTMHMLEPAHAAAHLLNPHRRSLRYYESARKTAADLEVVTECDSFFLAQTGGDPAGDAYLQVREQMRSFHSRVGHTTDRVTRDAEAEACVGDDETSRCASWWVEHDACFPDSHEIAGRVMHMWMSASPAETNWAKHERIHMAKRNKLEFRKVEQLVEIATNLKLLGCSEWSGGYVLPWGHMVTAEAQPEEYTHPVVADKDEEEEPEPEEWGARPQAGVPTHKIGAQVRRFQQEGARRPVGVAEVFGARAEILHPYDYVPPPPAEPVQASEDQTDTEGGKDVPPGVDKIAERLYYTYGGGADGLQPRCTFIRESDDDPIPANDIGLERGRRDASGSTSRVARRGGSGDALGGSSGAPLGRCREREVTGLDSAGDDDDDDEPLLLRRARLAQQGAARPAPAAEGLRKSARLQQTLAGSTSSGRREASDHLDDIGAEEHFPIQHTPTSAPRGDSQQREMRTSDFQGLGPGFAGSGVRGRTDGRERVGDEADYHPVQGGGAESMEELHARMDREEEQRLEGLQREWAGRDKYMAEQQRVRDLETSTAVRDPGDPATQEAVPMDGDSGELDGGRRPDAEGDDGAGDADRLAPAHSTGPSRSSHGPIGGDACGPVQGDAHVDDAGGSMSWVLVLRHPSPVAHEDASHLAEGRGGVDEEGEGGTTHDRPDPMRADMEGQITLGLLDPDALHHAAVEDPITT
ncbi:hypothetical protein CBR_g31461 [Chara braunii]|uniref:Integrase catalytic domain-containing protein n=1 Tax=Chara braunii TaxID=69332 RepID=A0A388LF26_CHABU|nr:hypothetical protein CBR_g31461 [Chara braunii]|eukprot:GBG80905.1 hypothetical protein CBR_g31461 [Chara braunii]